LRKKNQRQKSEIVKQLIILSPWKDQFAAVKKIVSLVASPMQELGIQFEPGGQLKIADRIGLPDGKGSLAFELQTQFDERVSAVFDAAASHFVSFHATETKLGLSIKRSIAGDLIASGHIKMWVRQFFHGFAAQVG
jgi:hypothetical protein